MIRILPDNLEAARASLREADSHLGLVMDQLGEIPLRRKPAELLTLCEIVIGQQVSIHAAASINRRFSALLADRDAAAVTAAHLLALSEEDMRSAGLSRAKAATIHAIAEFWAGEGLSRAKVEEMTEDELMKLLTRVKGIGPWSVKMFLMFALQRADVMPQEDLGVRAGLRKIHGLAANPTPKETITLTQCWHPWRTLGAHYCWAILKAV